MHLRNGQPRSTLETIDDIATSVFTSLKACRLLPCRNAKEAMDDIRNEVAVEWLRDEREGKNLSRWVTFIRVKSTIAKRVSRTYNDLEISPNRYSPDLFDKLDCKLDAEALCQQAGLSPLEYSQLIYHFQNDRLTNSYYDKQGRRQVPPLRLKRLIAKVKEKKE